MRFDPWGEVVLVRVHDPGAPPRNVAMLTLPEASRACFDAHDVSIVDRRYLDAGTPYFLAVALDEVDTSHAQRSWIAQPPRDASYPSPFFGSSVFPLFGSAVFPGVQALEQRASLPAGMTEIRPSDPLFVDLETFALALGGPPALARLRTGTFVP